MEIHISDAIKKPAIIKLSANLYVARFESMKLFSTLYAIETLLQNGKIDHRTTLIDSSSGVYAHALALSCHKYNLKCHIIASKAIDKVTKLQLELLGAYVESVPSAGSLKLDQKYRVEKVINIIKERKDYYWMQQYHDDIHYGGYEEFAKIVLEKLNCDALTVVGGVGSGCSTGALATYLRKRGIEVNLCGIQPFGSMTFGAEAVEDHEIIIAGIGSSIDFLNVKHEYYNSINWLSFSACLSGTIELMKAHAIFAGLSSGGSYCVGKREAKLKPEIPCLVILPDTGHRYIESVFSRYEESQPLDMFEPKTIRTATQLALPWSRFEWNKNNKQYLQLFSQNNSN